MEKRLSLQYVRVVKYVNQFGGRWQGYLKVPASGFQVWILLAFPQTLPEDQSLGRLLCVLFSSSWLPVLIKPSSCLYFFFKLFPLELLILGEGGP